MPDAETLKPVDAAFERFAVSGRRRDLPHHFAARNLRIELSEAQLGEAFLVINDAAALTHSAFA